VLNDHSKFYSWEDFNLGVNVNFFQRVFRITDCDEFTRNFYLEMERPLNASEEIP